MRVFGGGGGGGGGLSQAEADLRYVRLSGATLTGPLAFSGANHAGIRLNNLTTTERDALTPAAGMVVYNSTANRVQFRNNASWEELVRRSGDTLTGPLGVSGGTVTASAPLLDLSQTWNAAGVPFTGLKANITDTASAAASNLLDLQAGGASKFRVSKAGDVVIPAENRIYLTGTLGSGASIEGFGTTQIKMYANHVLNWHFSGGIGLINSAWLGWHSSTAAFNPQSDVRLYRDGPGVFALRNDTNAQAQRTYETFTDVSNNSYLSINAQAAGDFQIRPVANGTGTLRGLQLGVASGKLGFFGTTAATKPEVTGAHGSNAALESLLSALATLGLITNSATA